MLRTGEAPTRRTHSRHFLEREEGHQLHIPTVCGVWNNGQNHFLTFYLCADYWSIMDPLQDIPLPRPRMQANLNQALRNSFRARNLPDSPLPPYIAIQNDAPRPNWSCGTIAMCSALHLLLGTSRSHTLPTMYISRDQTLVLHKAFLAWLLTGTPTMIWEIGCLQIDIIPPPSANVGPYTQLSVAATIASPKGEHWRHAHPTQSSEIASNSTPLPRQHTRTHTSEGSVIPHLQVSPPAPLHNPPPTTELGNHR